ncbi:MATN1-like protein [Mya arenaria]|uniref:MATN1-like protein n=1 Tax=Mya arenaria TaxID=6604 RepID=A0ABY7FUH6_MYAAR|nr:MATN1-like protein [Mya arenaria]
MRTGASLPILSAYASRGAFGKNKKTIDNRKSVIKTIFRWGSRKIVHRPVRELIPSHPGNQMFCCQTVQAVRVLTSGIKYENFVMYIRFRKPLSAGLGKTGQCAMPADVAFVIDSSSSIWETYFKIQLEFIKRLVEKFDVSKNNTHVAALTFSTKAVQQFHFNAVQDKDRILSQLTAIRQDNGRTTQTHTALEVTMTDLFAQETGARDNVPHIAIVLTDGKATEGAATLQAADDVKQSGIKIMTVGIGDKVDDEELKAVASPPASDNYFKIKKFDDLKGIEWQELIALQACEACQGKHADIVFVIDSSASIQPEDFKTQLSFISDVISDFDVEGGNTQTLLNDVMSVKNGARPQTAARIAVLITDGLSTRPDLTLSAAKDVHTDGIYMFAIGVGNNTDRAELDNIASKPVNEYAFEFLETKRNAQASSRQRSCLGSMVSAVNPGCKLSSS